jgi:hypothetical protein
MDAVKKSVIYPLKGSCITHYTGISLAQWFTLFHTPCLFLEETIIGLPLPPELIGDSGT